MSFATSPYEIINSTTAYDVPGPENPPSPSSAQAQPILFVPPAEPGQGPRRRPRVKAWLPLTSDGDYSEFQVFAWLRYPDAINTEMASGETPRITAALKRLVIAHNGWPDPADESRALPPVDQECPGETDFTEPACCFWHRVSGDELILIMRAIHAERGKVLASPLGGAKP